jgi:hypothetical protein
LKRFRVEFSPAAAAHAEAVDTWWRANRDRAPGLFARELEAAVRHLRRAPYSAPRYDASVVAGTRRLLLPRTRHHVYFVIDDAAAVVRVYAVWHTSRGGGPSGT